MYELKTGGRLKISDIVVQEKIEKSYKSISLHNHPQTYYTLLFPTP